MNPISCIIPATEEEGGLYLGNIYGSYSSEILKKHKIKAVLTVAAGIKLFYSDSNIMHKIVNALDMSHYNISRHFSSMINFIDE